MLLALSRAHKVGCASIVEQDIIKLGKRVGSFEQAELTAVRREPVLRLDRGKCKCNTYFWWREMQYDLVDLKKQSSS